MEVILTGALSGASVGLFLMLGVYVVFDAGSPFSIWWKYNRVNFIKTLIITAILGAIIIYLNGGTSSAPMCRGGLGWSNCP